MQLSPADVHNVAFSKPPIGKRGYNEDEVDEFLDLVERQLATLVEENNDLRQRIQELDEQVAQGSSGGVGGGSQRDYPNSARGMSSPKAVAAPPAPEPVRAQSNGAGDSGQATRVLQMAQEMADRLTGEARAESDQLSGSAKASAEKMVSDATSRSEGMLSEARSKADQLSADARAKADATLSDARTRAETLQRQAKEKADALQADSERKHTELLGSISGQRAALEKKIEELRTFEREYRTRLKTYLESQLQELGQRGSAAPAETARAGTNGSGSSGYNSSYGARSEQTT